MAPATSGIGLAAAAANDAAVIQVGSFVRTRYAFTASKDDRTYKKKLTRCDTDANILK